MMENARSKCSIQFRTLEADSRFRSAMAIGLVAQIALLSVGTSGCMASVQSVRESAALSISARLGKPSGPKRSLASSGVEAALAFGSLADGSIQIVDVLAPDSLEAARIRVEFEGEEVPLVALSSAGGRRRLQGFFGVPFNRTPGKARVHVSLLDGAGGKTIEQADLDFESVDGNYRSETLKVDDSHVNPTPRDLKRIERERQEIGAIYSRPSLTKYWAGPFMLPIESPFTSPFGTKRMFNGQMKSFHQGVDLKAAIGTPIRAPSGGRVALAKDLFMTGRTVILDHGFGMFTIYAHMSRLEVKVGDEVKAGQSLGLSGMTGRASGPHLHWGAVLHGSKVNPVELTQVLE